MSAVMLAKKNEGKDHKTCAEIAKEGGNALSPVQANITKVKEEPTKELTLDNVSQARSETMGEGKMTTMPQN